MSRLNVANFRHPDATADSVVITSGGDTQIQRALGLGGATYGTSGQVLTSAGSGSAPTWSDSLSQTFTAVTLSGSAQVFSGIPSTAYRVVVTLGGMSFSDTANMEFVLGYGSGPTYQTTTYYYSRGTFNSQGEQNNQSEFDNASFTGSDNEYSGQFVFQKTSGNRWHVEGFFMEEGQAAPGLINGFVILSEPLTAIKIEGSAGSFDAGNASIWYLSE